MIYNQNAPVYNEHLRIDVVAALSIISFLGLVLASSISLGFLPIIAHYLKGNPPKFNQGKPVKDDIMFNPYLRDAAFWFVGLSASSLISSVLGTCF